MLRSILNVTLMFGALAFPAHIPRPAERGITLFEYEFVGLPSSATRTLARVENWHVTNSGRELHEITVLRLSDSTQLGEVEAWVARGASLLLPPTDVAVHVDALLPGASVDRSVTLEAGLYVVICLVPAERRTDGSIEHHANRGMRTTFVVSPQTE